MKRALFLAFAMAFASFLGCNKSTEPEDDSPKIKCSINGFTYRSKEEYDVYCFEKYCPSDKKTYTNRDYYTSSCIELPYCCENNPNKCYETMSKMIVNCKDPEPIYVPSSSSRTLKSSSSRATTPTNTNKCSSNSCYNTMIHTAAGSSMGSGQVANMCRCTL